MTSTTKNTNGANKVVQEVRIYSPPGERLYLNKKERERFLAQVRTDENRDAAIFCTLLHYTGARPMELRELTVDRVHPDINQIVVRSVKKHTHDKNGNVCLPQYREIPLRPDIMDLVSLPFNIRARQKNGDTSLLWPSTKHPNQPISSKTTYNWVKRHMTAAGITGKRANPKGLRHGYAITMLQAGLQLPQIAKLMGHSSMEVTAIYLDAVGPELHEMATKAF